MLTKHWAQVSRRFDYWLHSFRNTWKTQSLQASVFFLAGVWFSQNQAINFSFSLNTVLPSKQETRAPIEGQAQLTHLGASDLANPATAVGAGLTEAQKREAQKYNNLSIAFNPDLAKRMDPSVFALKKETCQRYIQTYLKTAQEEAKLYNIPVAIKLAQALLETNAGASSLAQKENNHFGIKCVNKCLGCRCANYADDDRYDMFRIFESAWGSFRAHSKLLQNKRYKHLLELPRTDYVRWAYGLKQAGYATDTRYSEKLITIIEYFKLDQYDN